MKIWPEQPQSNTRKRVNNRPEKARMTQNREESIGKRIEFLESAYSKNLNKNAHFCSFQRSHVVDLSLSSSLQGLGEIGQRLPRAEVGVGLDMYLFF